jgi:hypothetical protein
MPGMKLWQRGHGIRVVVRKQLSPDSAVAIDRKRKAKPFRSKVDGFLPLSRHRSAVLGAGCQAS